MKSPLNTFIAVIGICLLALSGPLCANLPEDPAEYAKWEAGLLKAVAKTRDMPTSEAIEKLGIWIVQLSQEC
ncbi:MAG: hypothetical protein K9N23_22855, partial [Akkermansiaceae bacterium]|nr:hypothetical protein [Akkermansiaceae bacterium]